MGDAELNQLFKFINATHVSPEPVFQGTSQQLAPVFQRLGLLPTKVVGKEEPGWLDNLANEITSDDTVILEAGQLAPWYEIGRRGSVLTTIGDYTSFFLHGLNTLLNSGDMARDKIGAEIDKIKGKYPVSLISPEDYADKERRELLENANEMERERMKHEEELKKWTPVKLEFEKDGKKGYISVIPASTLSYPFFDINPSGGKPEEMPAPYTPYSERYLGGVSLYPYGPSRTIVARDAPDLSGFRKVWKEATDYGG